MKTRLPLVLALLVTACPAEKGPADFRKLAAAAYPENGKQDMEALDALWTALFKLPKWYFIATPENKPSAESINGERFLLVYTDLQILNIYVQAKAPKAAPAAPPTGDPAKFTLDLGAPIAVADAGAVAAAPAGPVPPNPYLDADGKPRFVSMTPAEAVDYFTKYDGMKINGVRFNEGASRGWYAALSAVQEIYVMLRKSGKV